MQVHLRWGAWEPRGAHSVLDLSLRLATPVGALGCSSAPAPRGGPESPGRSPSPLSASGLPCTAQVPAAPRPSAPALGPCEWPHCPCPCTVSASQMPRGTNGCHESKFESQSQFPTFIKEMINISRPEAETPKVSGTKPGGPLLPLNRSDPGWKLHPGLVLGVLW